MTDIRYMTSKDAAIKLGKTTRTIINLCQNGKLAGSRKKGRDWEIPVESVESYLQNTKPANNNHTILSCAVGNTSYIDVVKNSYYVDKTLMIRELVDDQDPVILFTRPRRFGKTLTLDMLKVFFEKSEEDTSIYFREKKIWSCGRKYQELQGKFPVISISFKDAQYDHLENTLETIKYVLRDEFMRHSELLTSTSINSVEQDYLLRMQNGTLSEVEYARALLYLSNMLAKHHNSKVIILIDEYDTPIQHGYSRDFYNDVISFMRNLMSGGLKDNPSLKLGVLTGILRVSKENLFSGLNNLIVNSVLDEKYSEYFGFTVDEVDSMTEYYGRTDKKTELRDWYDGYRFGSTDIYNPWSVANYFNNNCKAKPYWVNTSDNEIIHQIIASLTPEISSNLLSLLEGQTIQTSIKTDVIYPQLTDDTDRIFSFLLVAGYLKPVTEVIETEYGTFTELGLPNKEIRRVYNIEILSWLKNRVSSNVVSDLEKSIYTNNAEMLKESLRKYMITCISSFDGAAEGFYHGMVLGLVAGMSSRYYIRSNRESGEGRFDLMLEPKERPLPGIIMEFKAVKDKTDLTEKADEALAQIDNKQYSTELRERGVQVIVKYGIAFCGKTVEVKIGM